MEANHGKDQGNLGTTASIHLIILIIPQPSFSWLRLAYDEIKLDDMDAPETKDVLSPRNQNTSLAPASTTFTTQGLVNILLYAPKKITRYLRSSYS
ncbi:unnamed protein product [Allacma fusca]|uniref:Uncharacterized protein n=1 Tax=Allacma fusca TaxID=39272 RepID=A0A8J2P3V4_9HEXA|nr:unnamed protein product [Allacma fusca]